MNKIIVAIDGFAGCGKSTLARQLATQLGYTFLDTGAMYRAVALYLLQQNIRLTDADAVQMALAKISIRMGTDAFGNTLTWLNNVPVEQEIRSMQVSNIVSEVAAISSVRRFLVREQQRIGKEKGIVMDGRDIGTVVFPEAELKLFVTADMETRVERRHGELREAGIEISREEIRENLIKRDREETERSDSPLKQADDAILLDNTGMSRDEQLAFALGLAHQRIAAYSAD